MKRLELLKALQAVIPGVARGESRLEGTDSFVFRNGLIQSYNDFLSVTYPMDAGVEGSVRAAEMVKVLERMSGLDIHIEVRENALVITDGATTLSMRLIEAGTASLLEGLALGDLDWSDIPKDFPAALSSCLPSVSTMSGHGVLTGIRVEGVDMMSSDHFRASWVTMQSGMGEFTLPGGAARELLKVPDLGYYSLAESWIHFMSAEGAVFSSRLIGTEYPAAALRGLFPEPGQDSYRMPDRVEDAIGRVGVFAYTQDDGRDYVTLRADGGKLSIRGERQYGSIREDLPIRDGEWPDGIGISIQPGYLLDILSRTRTFQLAGPLVYFHGEGFRHIIATIATS